jgi:hypothetical protein
MDLEILFSVAAMALGLAAIGVVAFQVGRYIKRWLHNRRNAWRHIPRADVDHASDIGQFYQPNTDVDHADSGRFYIPDSMRDRK